MFEAYRTSTDGSPPDPPNRPHVHRWYFRGVLGLGLLLSLLLMAVGVGGLQIWLLRARLQSFADACATAEASRLARSAASGPISQKPTSLSDQVTPVSARRQSLQVVPGIWDFVRRRFHPTDGAANAVRVVLSSDAGPLGPWGRMVAAAAGMPSEFRAQAVAAAVPRDIVFLVDMSGAMNDDTEPAWAPAAAALPISKRTDTTSCPWLQDVYDDFGFGTYPGEEEDFGAPWGIRWNESAYAELTHNRGPLAGPNVPEPYRILPSDDPLTRKRKAYSAVIDDQIARLMPRALPTPDSRLNYDFWAAYLDYLLIPAFASSPSVRDALLPPNQGTNRLDRFRNPDRFAYPRIPPGILAKSAGRIGYRTYVQFMMDFGRDLKPAESLPVPLSHRSPNCPLRAETLPEGVASFPPREQPMHGVRRALIAAIHALRERNAAPADAELRDRVAVVGYDAPQSGGAIVLQGLTDDYRSAMESCSRLQAGCDKPSREDVAAGLRAGLQTARELVAGRSGSLPTPRDPWIVLIRYDGDENPEHAPASRRSETAWRSRNAGRSPGPEPAATLGRDEAAEMIARLRLEGITVLTFTVGPANSHAGWNETASTDGEAHPAALHHASPRNPIEVERRLTEFLRTSASAPRIQLVQ
ncbi:hypothetical protein [Thermopirellula anaerolimosa]